MLLKRWSHSWWSWRRWAYLLPFLEVSEAILLNQLVDLNVSEFPQKVVCSEKEWQGGGFSICMKIFLFTTHWTTANFNTSMCGQTQSCALSSEMADCKVPSLGNGATLCVQFFWDTLAGPCCGLFYHIWHERLLKILNEPWIVMSLENIRSSQIFQSSAKAFKSPSHSRIQALMCNLGKDCWISILPSYRLDGRVNDWNL